MSQSNNINRDPIPGVSSVKEIGRKCDKFEKYIKKNPPNVLGHLLGGIDADRMTKLKEEIEIDGWLPKYKAIKKRLNRIKKTEEINTRLNRNISPYW